MSKIANSSASPVANQNGRVTREPEPVDLSGVSATLLPNLARRAAAARAKNPLLDDAFAVEVV